MKPDSLPETDHWGATSKISARNRFADVLTAAGRRWSSDEGGHLGPKARAIVFAPHPDDEVLGCGGTIALKARAGADLLVVVMTDGRTSHASLMDAPTLTAMRRSEAIEAGKRLGLEPADYLFLDFEDHRLHECSEHAKQRVLEILQRFEPEQAFVSHRNDRLSDHVATYEIVASAIGAYNKPVTLLEYPVWLWNTWPWVANFPRGRALFSEVPRMLRDSAELAFGCSTRFDIRPLLPVKLEALAQYRSQVLRRGNDPRWPILSDVSGGTFLDRFLTGFEVFRQTKYHARV